VVHDAEFVLSEYVFAAHAGHAWSAVTEQEPLLNVPGWHTLQGVQALAPAADQLLLATQALHTVFDVAVHVALRYVPAAHVDEAQALQGA